MPTPASHVRAEELQREGCALERIAQTLDAEGYSAPGSLGRWTAPEVARALAQLALARSGSPERQAALRQREARRGR